MKLISGLKQFNINEPTAVAIGKFDGVHLGHKKLLDQILQAKADGLKATVFTFDPPVEELFGRSKGKIFGDFLYLTTKEEKRKIMESMGIDYLVEFPIDLETAAIEPEDFVNDYIKKSLNAKLIVCGDDLSFGNKGRGDFRLLKSMANECDFEAMSIDKVRVADKVVSSTAVRDYICNGQLSDAANMLGYNYFLSGAVVKGNQIGRSFDVPTVNLDIPANKLIPENGVYYSNLYIENDSKVYKSITNIGRKPTIKDDNAVNAESFIYDFSENIYGKEIKVELLEFRRKEMKFENLSTLEKTIKADIEAGRNR